MKALPYYKEEWKDIEGFEGVYQVSNFIKVLNVITGKLLKPTKLNNGYMQVCLCKNGVHKKFQLHRLIAQAFVPNPNPEKYTDIDHINTYKDSNWYLNLQWVDKKKQMENPLTRIHISKSKTGKKHPFYHKYGNLNHNSKPVLQFDLNNNFIQEWECARQVERELGISFKYISRCCKGEYGRKTAGGYIWKFKD